MRMPFDKYLTLPITIEDGVEKCHDFMANAQKTLDDAVYGLNDAKMQIMQMLGQLITNPKAIGTAIAIHIVLTAVHYAMERAWLKITWGKI